MELLENIGGDRLFHVIRSVSTLLPIPWVEEQLLRRELKRIRPLSGMFHQDAVDVAWKIAGTLMEQDRFEDAERVVLKTMMQCRMATPITESASCQGMDRLVILYRKWLYNLLFPSNFAPLPGRNGIQAKRVLEAVISLCLQLSEDNTLTAPCLDALGRMLAWAGLKTEARRAMELRRTMELRRQAAKDSFGSCDLCGESISSGATVYFCQWCENRTVCQPCQSRCADNSSYDDRLQGCLTHLIQLPPASPVQYGSSSNNNNTIATSIRAGLEALLDAVHARRHIGDDVWTGSISPTIPIRSLCSVNSLPVDTVNASNILPSYEFLKRYFRENSYSTFMDGMGSDYAEAQKNTLNLFFLAMVQNTRSILPQKYRDAFGADVRDDFNVATLLPMLHDDLDSEDDDNLHKKTIAFQDVAARIFQLARKEGRDLAGLEISPQTHDKSSSDLQIETRYHRVIPDRLYLEHILTADPNAIRVVELLPGTKDLSKDPIRCNLRVVSTTNIHAAPYEALSYVWGVSEVNKCPEILVNDLPVLVTPNLYSALCCLRLESEPRQLWIDALCIHQANLTERNAQVSKMAMIYQNASSVVVFLGEEEDDEDMSYADLFLLLNRQADMLEKIPREIGELGEEEEQTDDSGGKEKNSNMTGETTLKEVLQKLHLEQTPLLKAFFDLCSREWWLRVWVLQEYAIAATAPVFVLGTRKTTADCLQRDMKMLLEAYKENIKLEELRIKNYRNVFYDPLAQALGIVDYRNRGVDSPRRTSWLYQLLLAANSWSSDPRDIVYGRLVLLPPLQQQLFRSDYSIPTAELFERLAVWFLVFERGIEVFWDFPKRLSPYMPSWVPDFTQPRQKSRADIQWEISDKAIGIDRYPVIFRGELALYGRTIDTISEVLPLNAQDDFKMDYLRKLWFLDMGFMTLGAQIPLWKRHYLSAKFPAMYREDPLRRWCTSCPAVTLHTSVSAFLVDNTHMSSLYSMVSIIISPVLVLLRNRTESIGSCAGLAEPSGVRSVSPLLAHLRRISDKLISINIFILCTMMQQDLFGAALFDWGGLVQSLQNLRTPRRHRMAETTTLETNPAQDDLRSFRHILQNALGAVPSEFSSHTDRYGTGGSGSENTPKNPYPQLPKPTYEGIQRWVTNSAVLEEEVTLLSSVLLAIGHEINKECWDGLDYYLHVDENNHVLSKETRKAVAEYHSSNVMHSRRGLRYSRLRSEGSGLFQSRSFFLTKTGLVGVASLDAASVAAGDQVMLIDGAPVPMVLRKKTDDPARHEIVGYSHVRGLDPLEVLKLPQHWWPSQRLFKIV